MNQVAFLFPGQGAQHVGMAKIIVDRFPAAKELFAQADAILGFKLSQLCFEGPQEELDKTDISQPALYVSSLAALEMLRAEKPEVVAACSYAAGLSLGEYTALTFAGSISFEDGLKLVRRRGEAMQSAALATPSGMVSALLLDDEKVNAVVAKARAHGQIWIANYLCPGNTVLSGDKSACLAAEAIIEELGGRPIPLSVAGAFHTEIMRPAVEPLTLALRSANFEVPRFPVISNVDVQAHFEADQIRETLVKQVLNPVLWEKCIRKLQELGVTQFYEVGPGKVLKGLMKRIDRKAACETINDSP